MKTRKAKQIALLLTASITALTLCSCSEESKSTTQPSSPVISDQQASIAVYQAQIDYYEELTKELQAQLLKEKEENFITQCEYQLKIEELEESVKTLSEQIGSIAVGKDQDINEQKKPSSDSTNARPIPPASPDTLSARSDFTYTEANGQITVTGYTGTSPELIIPSAINGLPVTAIGESAFQGASVTSIVIPESITELGWFVFADCTALQKITIPATVTKVGYGAFDRCPPSMTIHCPADSYIAAYAASWGIRTE